MLQQSLPRKIRVSIGSALMLGLARGRMDAEPTTLYLLTYRRGKCSANCGFCPQARTSTSRADMLSRVSWPQFHTQKVLSGIEEAVKKGVIKRVCIQTLNYPTVFDDLLSIVRGILSRVKVAISVSCQPSDQEKVRRLAEAGVSRIGIPLDAATKAVFDRIKGRLAGGLYTWDKQRQALEEAVQVFGKGSVTTHLIVGLGETEKEMIQMIQWCVDQGVYPGMFAFTPISGTALENLPQPSISHYRRVQMAHHLITSGKTRCENMKFGESGCLVDFGVSEEQVRQLIRSGIPFLTSGCPDCNRPYYNEKPGGPIYNYPRQPVLGEIFEIEKQIRA